MAADAYIHSAIWWWCETETESVSLTRSLRARRSHRSFCDTHKKNIITLQYIQTKTRKRLKTPCAPSSSLSAHRRNRGRPLKSRYTQHLPKAFLTVRNSIRKFPQQQTEFQSNRRRPFWDPPPQQKQKRHRHHIESSSLSPSSGQQHTQICMLFVRTDEGLWMKSSVIWLLCVNMCVRVRVCVYRCVCVVARVGVPSRCVCDWGERVYRFCPHSIAIIYMQFHFIVSNSIPNLTYCSSSTTMLLRLLRIRAAKHQHIHKYTHLACALCVIVWVFMWILCVCVCGGGGLLVCVCEWVVWCGGGSKV